MTGKCSDSGEADAGMQDEMGSTKEPMIAKREELANTTESSAIGEPGINGRSRIVQNQSGLLLLCPPILSIIDALMHA